MILLAIPALARGVAWLDSASYPVDQKATIELHYVAGPSGLAPGDSITIDDPEFHGVRWSQWGIPVLDPSLCTAKRTDEDPSVGLITASTTGAATITVSRTVPADGGGAAEAAATVVEVTTGALADGDEIIVVYGDTTTNPDCGQELPERVFHHVPLTVSEVIEGGDPEALDSSPTFDIAADPALATLYVEAPSRVAAGVAFDLKVVPMDLHGNAIEGWPGTITVSGDYGGGSHAFSIDDDGHVELLVTITDSSRVHRIDVSSSDGVNGRSNPIQVYPSDAPPEEYIYWGDIHVHGGHDYVEDGESIDDNMRYARDIIGLDVASEAMKADPVCLDSEALWEHLEDLCTSETIDGSFVYLFGFEWMGNLLGSDNGHHNFYVDTCAIDRPAHYDAQAYPDGIDGFSSGRGPYEWADNVASAGVQTVIVPHAPVYTGYNWTGDAINDDYRRSAEVYSEWGFDMEPPDADGSIPDGLRKGNHMGFISSSDNHMGWLGNPFSYKTVPSGLAAFLAARLDRAAIFGSLRDRHTYATTGARILVDVGIEDGATIASGTRYVASAPVLRWSVSGTDKIAEVRVVSMAVVAGASITDACVDAPGTFDAEGSCTLDWDGETETVVWLEVRQDDDERAWASPFWLTTDCADGDVEDPAGRCDDAPGSEGGDDTGDTDGAGTNGETGVDEAGTAPRTRCSCASAASSPAGLLLLVALLRRRRS